MEKKEGHREAVPEEPTDNDKAWLRAAVVSFIFTVIAFGFAAAWVFASDNGQSNVRAQAFAPFGAALAAIVTFFTIVWRGVLNTRQLQYQAAQIAQQAAQLEQIRRQNDAKDQENLAKLLQEGAKLLGPDEKQTNLLAGIASLAVLLSDKDDRFSSHAMDVLADFATASMGVKGIERAFDAANRVLLQAAKEGRAATFGNFITKPPNDTTGLQPVFGLRWVVYEGGTIYGPAFGEMANVSNHGGFRGTTFYKCEIDKLYEFKECVFEKCSIKVMDAERLYECRFTECDFSGAQISKAIWPRPITLGEGSHDNYFYEDEPPVSEIDYNWETLFEVRDPIPF